MHHGHGVVERNLDRQALTGAAVGDLFHFAALDRFRHVGVQVEEERLRVGGVRPDVQVVFGLEAIQLEATALVLLFSRESKLTQSVLSVTSNDAGGALVVGDPADRRLVADLTEKVQERDALDRAIGIVAAQV